LALLLAAALAALALATKHALLKITDLCLRHLAMRGLQGFAARP
jgi:hypothetical protein